MDELKSAMKDKRGGEFGWDDLNDGLTIHY